METQAKPQPAPRGRPFEPGNTIGRNGRRGKAAEREAERQQEAARLLAGLGHPACPAEAVLVEQASALIVRVRWLRRSGFDRRADDAARLLKRYLGQLVGDQGSRTARSGRPSYGDVARGHP